MKYFVREFMRHLMLEIGEHFPKLVFFLGVLLLLSFGLVSLSPPGTHPAPHQLHPQAPQAPAHQAESALGPASVAGGRTPASQSSRDQSTNSYSAALSQRDGSAPPAATFAIGYSEIMRGLITVVLLGASLFVILAKRYSPDDKHWAYATIGTILGFWFPK